MWLSLSIITQPTCQDNRLRGILTHVYGDTRIQVFLASFHKFLFCTSAAPLGLIRFKLSSLHQSSYYFAHSQWTIQNNWISSKQLVTYLDILVIPSTRPLYGFLVICLLLNSSHHIYLHCAIVSNIKLLFHRQHNSFSYDKPTYRNCELWELLYRSLMEKIKLYF